MSDWIKKAAPTDDSTWVLLGGAALIVAILATWGVHRGVTRGAQEAVTAVCSSLKPADSCSEEVFIVSSFNGSRRVCPHPDHVLRVEHLGGQVLGLCQCRSKSPPCGAPVDSGDCVLVQPPDKDGFLWLCPRAAR